MNRIKMIIVLGMFLIFLLPFNIQAEENEELVCYYVENCEGELELICQEADIPAPCEFPCPPGCDDFD